MIVKGRLLAMIALCACVALSAAAGQEQEPLTNADVVAMVKSGLPQRTIIRSVATSPNAFDVSPDALIELHNSGVGEKILDAMIAAAKKSRPRNRPAISGAQAARGVRGRLAGTPVPDSSVVSLVKAGGTQPIPMERTRLAQSKTKPESLGALAKDAAVDEAVRTGARAARGIGNRDAGGALSRVARSAASALSKGDKDVTYVWMVPAAASETVIPGDSPVFEIALEKLPALAPADYAPAIVKLTPTAKGNRLVGATEGEVGSASRTELDWPLYSGFLEERVSVEVSSVSRGVWRVTPSAALPPGEYAIVLRPVSKDKKFSGADVARNQGDGVAFNSVWAFSIR